MTLWPSLCFSPEPAATQSAHRRGFGTSVQPVPPGGHSYKDHTEWNHPLSGGQAQMRRDVDVPTGGMSPQGMLGQMPGAPKVTGSPFSFRHSWNHDRDI